MVHKHQVTYLKTAMWCCTVPCQAVLGSAALDCTVFVLCCSVLCWSMLRWPALIRALSSSKAVAVTPTGYFLWGGWGVQTKMSGVACSLYSTQDNPSASRFRAVQCYDDPTMAVVADLTRSED